MMQNSQEDLRLVYMNGLRSLAISNFSKRDSKGNIVEQPSKAQVDEWVKAINPDEITPGYMRTETTLRVSTSNFIFPIVTTDQVANSPVTPTMRLIVQQDSFLVNAMSYSLVSYAMTAGGGGQQQNIDFTADNDWSPITYVDQYHGNSPTVVMDNGCGLFWFGAFINITVNKHELIPYWDCEKHYFVGQTQTSTYQTTPNLKTKNQLTASSDNYYPVQPNIIFGGMRSSVVTLNLPANIPAVAPFSLSGYNDSFVYKAVLNFQGLLMQNSTSAR